VLSNFMMGNSHDRRLEARVEVIEISCLGLFQHFHSWTLDLILSRLVYKRFQLATKVNVCLHNVERNFHLL